MKYSTIAKVYDLGPFVYKIVLDVEKTLSNCNLSADTFRVHVVRKDRQTGKTVQIPIEWGSKKTYSSEGERKVINAYISDKEGNPLKTSSFITLELEVDPRISLGSTIAFNGKVNVFVDLDYTITQVEPLKCREHVLENMVFDELDYEKTLLADKFNTGEGVYNDIPLMYAYYKPETNASKRPLLIWLHGGGEGGKEPLIAVSGNKVVNLISDETQSFFEGCYVLGPQAPTFWLDDGSGEYTDSGKTMYLEALKELIDEFIDSHDDIDRDRIYIGGCSNGGFMTMKLIIAYPEMFAAAYPICQAHADKNIGDEDINKIKNIPIWFVHAENDPIVKIDLFTDPTYKRLIESGASKVHYTRLKSVVDQTGMYYKEDGTRYEYNGHFTWIPALNNECSLDFDGEPVICNGKKVSLFEWISLQRRQ